MAICRTTCSPRCARCRRCSRPNRCISRVSVAAKEPRRRRDAATVASPGNRNRAPSYGTSLFFGGSAMRSYCLAFVVSTAVAAVLPAAAAEIEAKSQIDAVTVYPDGASVTRLIRLDLPAGDNTLLVRDFPLTLDPSSLRVEGEGGAAGDRRRRRAAAATGGAREPGGYRQAHRGPAPSTRRAPRRDRSRQCPP